MLNRLRAVPHRRVRARGQNPRQIVLRFRADLGLIAKILRSCSAAWTGIAGLKENRSNVLCVMDIGFHTQAAGCLKMKNSFATSSLMAQSVREAPVCHGVHPA